MKIAFSFLWFLCFLLLFSGCDNLFDVEKPEQVPKEPVPEVKTIAPEPEREPENTITVEEPPEPSFMEEAHEVLTLALDSWAFRDSVHDFRRANPTIEYADFEWSLGYSLLRYEIGQSRNSGNNSGEIVAILTQVTQGGQEVKKKMNFLISFRPEEGRWSIIGLKY